MAKPAITTNPPPNPNKGPTATQIQAAQAGIAAGGDLSSTLVPLLEALGMSASDAQNLAAATASTSGGSSSTQANAAQQALLDQAQTYISSLSPQDLSALQASLSQANLLPTTIGGVSDEGLQGAVATLLQLQGEMKTSNNPSIVTAAGSIGSTLQYYNQNIQLSPDQQQTQQLSSLEAGYYEIERPYMEQEIPIEESTLPVQAAQAKQSLATLASQPSDTANTLMTQATTQWMVPLTSAQAEDWGNKITQGTATTTDFQNWARGQAEALYPSLSSYIQKGVDPSTLLQPYVNQAASELEIDPSTVTANSPYLSPSMLQNQDGTLRNTYQYTQALRQDPSWRYTGTANDLASSWAASLAQTFGGVSAGAQAPSASEETS